MRVLISKFIFTKHNLVKIDTMHQVEIVFQREAFSERNFVGAFGDALK